MAGIQHAPSGRDKPLCFWEKDACFRDFYLYPPGEMGRIRAKYRKRCFYGFCLEEPLTNVRQGSIILYKHSPIFKNIHLEVV